MKRSTKRKSRMPDIPNLSELIEQVERSFFEAMRRPPKEGDRLFHWSYCYSDTEFSRVNHSGFLLTHDNDENFKVFVSMLTCLISSMTMQSILSLRNISEISRWDISLFCFATRHIILDSAAPSGSELEHLFPKMKARAAVLPAKVKRFTVANKTKVH